MPTVPKLFGPNRTYERWRWQIFGITWLAYAGFYLTRKSFSVVKKELTDVLGLTKPEIGWIDGGFLTAYAIGMVLCGICGDRFGTRKVVLIGVVGSVLTAVAMGSSSSFMLLAVFFTLQGIFQSTGWAPLAKNIANFFSRRERGVVMGVWCTNYALGGLVASIFAGFVGQHFGWRWAFILPAMVLALVAVLFFLFQRNRPEDVGLPPIEVYHAETPEAAKPTEVGAVEADGSWKTILEVLTNPMVLLLAAIYFCLKPARYAFLLWGPFYASDKLGSGMAESGFLSAMFELAGPFSVIVAGLVSDKLFSSRRMPVSIICLFLLSGLLFVFDDLPSNRWMFGLSFFLIGLLTYAPDSLISGTACMDFGTKKGASTASGIVNGAGSVGAIVGGTVPGFFQAQWGWSGVFAFLGVAVLLAALLLLPKWNAVPKET